MPPEQPEEARPVEAGEQPDGGERIVAGGRGGRPCGRARASRELRRVQRKKRRPPEWTPPREEDPERFPPRQEPVRIWMRFGCTSGFFGRVTVSTPFSKLASIAFSSISTGIGMRRRNAP